jgi:hypothetical protein
MWRWKRLAAPAFIAPPRAVLIASLPTIVIFPALRRSFAGGMTGAVK